MKGRNSVSKRRVAVLDLKRILFKFKEGQASLSVSLKLEKLKLTEVHTFNNKFNT
jgi:hypothetical protein